MGPWPQKTNGQPKLASPTCPAQVRKPTPLSRHQPHECHYSYEHWPWEENTAASCYWWAWAASSGVAAPQGGSQQCPNAVNCMKWCLRHHCAQHWLVRHRGHQLVFMANHRNGWCSEDHHWSCSTVSGERSASMGSAAPLLLYQASSKDFSALDGARSTVSGRETPLAMREMPPWCAQHRWVHTILLGACYNGWCILHHRVRRVPHHLWWWLPTAFKVVKKY